MPDVLSNAPPAVTAALDRLRDELTRTAGANLVGLILYGGLARGRYRPGKSDVNVVVLLRDASASVLVAIAPVLRAARRSADVVPMILTPAEVAPTAMVFPIKFLDIKDHHVVLHGEDPFAALDVPRAQVSWRIVQELRNLTLRLRGRFVAALGEPGRQAAILAGIARPLAIELQALLRLAGREVAGEDRTTTVFRTAAEVFAADGDALARLAALRQGEPRPDDLAALFDRVLAVLGQLTDHAERLKEVPR
jgi:hypothetical protein